MNKSLLLKLTSMVCLLFSAQASATPVGENAGEISVDRLETTPPTLNPGRPDAAVDASGRSIFVWDGNPEINGGRDIFLRIYDVGGRPEGDAVVDNTYLTDNQHYPRVAVSHDGSFLVIWKDDEEAGDSWEIRGRLFSPNLVAQGADFRINTLTAGGQLNPKAAAYAQGGFFVVWESGVSAGDDNAPNSIEGRIVTGNDQFAGPQFLVNSWTEDSQQIPGIGGKNGRIAAAWDSQSNPENMDSAIRGQFWYICGIFCDSFEGE